MSNIDKIIKSYNKIKKTRQEYFIHGNTLLLVQGELSEDINIERIKKKVEKNLPRRLFKDLDWVYIGEFPELQVRDVGSVYLRGAIYITNQNQTEDSIYASIVHELAHSIDTTFKEYLYGDSEVANEFVIKRKKLRELLKQEGIEYEDSSFFIRQEYNPQFDEFLYKTVGYDKLNQICVGLFASPYGATSLREYFANGFEHFYLDDRDYLSKISPKLFLKIYKLTKKAE
jgi:hypothetical protein